MKFIVPLRLLPTFRGQKKTNFKESLKERKQKASPKKKERVPFCQEKKNIPLWKWLVLAELHAGVKISIKEVPVELKFAKHAVKNEISFSLCKYQPWYKNMNNRFES